MKILEYTVRFNTPAFLGNAQRDGQWRTPPFKALLRQWWRVAYAAERQFSVDVDEMRRDEGRLFGHAWLTDDRDDKGRKVAARKSEVRLRLEGWSMGHLKNAPLVGKVKLGKKEIDGALYLGYGPVAQGPKLKGNAAIQVGEKATLRIAFPEGRGVEQAIGLMNAYGAVGGRSRNGWGSFELEGVSRLTEFPTRDWKAAFNLDWSHAFGKDDKGALVWQSEGQAKWEDSMKLLAQLRAGLRRAVPEPLMLACPANKRTMPHWKSDDRVPNSLRFKVRSDGTQFKALVFHMPCRPKDELWGKLNAETQKGFLDCYAKAHAFLDGNQQFLFRRTTV